MRSMRLAATLMAVAALSLPLSSYAQHHGHVHHGGDDGGWFPWLLLGAITAIALTAPPPQPVVVQPAVIPTAPAPIIVAPPSPAMAAPAEVPQAMWYYCDAVGKYYPYVATCPTGWTPVPAVPPGE
ncbi:MAG TPA: hypothetical protein VF816_03075 [Rhodocyclaceae bacterium]